MNKTTRKLYFSLLFVFSFSALAEAQQSYSFSFTPPVPLTYQELTNDSVVTNYPTGGLFMVNDVIGETFWFYNLPFHFGGLKTLSFGPNGFLRVDNDSSLIIIDAANTQLSLLDSSSRVSYSISGSSGSLLFKLQYKNVHLNNGPLGNYANFQIWYFQSTGIIEIHYGPRSANNATGYTTSNGPQVGIFYSADNFSVCYKKIWCTINPSNPVLDTTSNYVFSALPGIPDEGFIYRFTPTFSVSTPETINKEAINVYPNPAKDFLNITNIIGSSNETEIIFYDLEGRIISSHLTLQNNYQVNIEYLDTGMYMCEVINGNQKQTVRFIKTR